MEVKANANQPRPAARINGTLDKHLAAYMTVAAATGVGILALAQPSEAEVVYTATNQVLNTRNLVTVDFNNDGVTDLTFSYRGIAYGSYLFAQAGNNRLMNGNHPSEALPWGKRIGPAASFNAASVLIDNANFHSTCLSFGYFLNKKGYYLGVQFSIAGQIHYGWARLSVGKPCLRQQAVLTGYAYETIPGKPIVAGKTSGPKVGDAIAPDQLRAPSQQQANLGVLALGAEGLNIWRREEEAA